MEEREHRNFIDELDIYAIIPCIKDDEGLEKAIRSEQKVVFVLYGDLLNIGTIVRKLKNAGKVVFVNVDLLLGLSTKEVIIPYLQKRTNLDGILSSKASLLKEARECGLMTIHRFFLIDSLSYENMYKQLKVSKPDALQVLPGWDAVIGWITQKVDIPVVAGGLVCKSEMVDPIMKAGAAAIASTNIKLWDYE